MQAQNNIHPHSHLGDLASQTVSRVLISLIITAGFVIIELAAGLFSNSLALLTDAAHNFTDVIALGLSWQAIRLATRPANSSKTFGYHRAGILVAMVNSTSLAVIAIGIFYEAYKRFLSPPEVKSGVLITVAAIALIINLVTALLVKKGSENDLNMRSTFLHLMGDVISTLGAVIAGVIIYFTHWNWLDSLVSVFIGILILWNAWGILREAVDILLESTPRDVDVNNMVKDLMQVDGVQGVHDLHIWSITQELRTMSAHILTNDISVSEGAIIQNQVNELLAHHYNIAHATLQLECVGCHPELYCDMNGRLHHKHV